MKKMRRSLLYEMDEFETSIDHGNVKLLHGDKKMSVINVRKEMLRKEINRLDAMEEGEEKSMKLYRARNVLSFYDSFWREERRFDDTFPEITRELQSIVIPIGSNWCGGVVFRDTLFATAYDFMRLAQGGQYFNWHCFHNTANSMETIQ